MGFSINLDEKIPSDKYWKGQLICMKVQTHSFPRPPLKYSQDQTLLTFLTILGVRKLCSFNLILEEKAAA